MSLIEHRLIAGSGDGGGSEGDGGGVWGAGGGGGGQGGWRGVWKRWLATERHLHTVLRLWRSCKTVLSHLKLKLTKEVVLYSFCYDMHIQ